MNEFQYPMPEGKKKGCLPRKSRPGELCKLFAQEIDVIPRSNWSEHIGEVSLRPYVNEVFDQDGIGSCAAEASTQALQIVNAFAGREFVQLNPWFVYHTTSGGRDGGSNIDSNLEFLMEHGAAPMSVWGREHGFRSSPSSEANEEAKKYRIAEFFDITTIDEFGTALLLGMPVVYGRRGHALCAVELISDTEFRYVNSWHESWGDGGFAVESLSGVNFRYGAWAVRATTEA